MNDEILKEITENLSDFGSILPESFCRLTVRRLRRMGCAVETPEDAWDLAFSIRKVETGLQDYCHIGLVPSTLYPLLCDRACGMFLYDRKQSGRLELEGLDLSGILASLSEGDVSISFNTAESDEVRLDALLDVLRNAGKEQLSCYRKIKW